MKAKVEIIHTDGTVSHVYEDAVDVPIIQADYDDLVEQKIRQKYTVSAEFAVLRQRDEKPAEYAEYYAFCEQCKQEAKAELGIQ